MASISDLAKKRNIKIKYATKERFDKIITSKRHDGVCLKCDKKNMPELKKFSDLKQKLKKVKGNIVVIVDRISDAFNAGTIIRTCVYSGVDIIIMSKNDRPPIAGDIAKISSGASEMVELHSIKFIKKFLSEGSKEGWKVICAGVREEEESGSNKEEKLGNNEVSPPLDSKCKKVTLNELEIKKDDNYIIILTSDKYINSHLTSSNYQIFIPPLLNGDLSAIDKHPFNIIGSLNVGVTIGLILNHLKK
jgi:tRNA G18 (ribose-2'-O)-methylase SpoU